jgi:peptidoglycan/LPS O-acetylase OafA/YrhL
VNNYSRPLGIFLVQAIIIYTVGIKLYTHINAAGGNNAASGLVSFVVCAPLVVIAGEMFYRLVDLPSVVVARGFWAWITK